MVQFFEVFQYSFMIRAFVAGSMISLILGWLGVFVTTRRMSMIGDGIAHASLFFIAIGIVLDVFPLAVAIVGAVILGALLYYLTTYTKLSGDISTGIIFTAGMALGVVVLQFHDGYVPELMSFLFGNVLAIRTQDIIAISIGTLCILGFLFYKRLQLTFLTLDPEGAKLAGIQTKWLDLIFHIVVSVAVVLSIKLIGIILVSALLVLPSAIARRIASTFVSLQYIAVFVSWCIVVCGLYLSYLLNLPSGATIVLLGVFILILSYLKKWK